MIAARRRARPHAAGQQQHLRAGLRAEPGSHWDRADEPLIEFTAAVARLRQGAPDVPPEPVLRRPAGPARSRGRRRCPTSSGSPRTAAQMRARGLGQRLRPGRRRLPRTATASASGTPGAAAGHRRRLPPAASTPTTMPSQFTPARTTAWDVVIDTAGGCGSLLSRHDRHAAEGRSMLVLRAHTEPEAEPDHSVAASLACARRPEQTSRTPPGRLGGGVGRESADVPRRPTRTTA